MDPEQLTLPTHGARQRHTSWHGHGANQGRPGANPDVLWRLRDRVVTLIIILETVFKNPNRVRDAKLKLSII